MLSELDDYMIHQLVEPVRHVGTSDRNFYDRHYFNLYAPKQDMFVIFGLGQYPNLGTQDAFYLFGFGGSQTALRSSRRLTDRIDTTCGPISVKVVEGLKRLRIEVGPNDAGLEGSLTFNGVHEPVLEPRSLARVEGRVVHNILRFNQVGYYEGELKIHDRIISSSAHGLRGYRDRSWGIRPVGEPEPDGVNKFNTGGAASASRSFKFYKIPADFKEFSVHSNVIEDGNGHRILDQAELVWHHNGPREKLGSPRFELKFDQHRRFVISARVIFPTEDGTERVLGVKPRVPLFVEAGTGYGRAVASDWMHGAFRGDNVTDVVAFDFDRLDRGLYGGIDAYATYDFEGHIGYGLFEYSLYGKLDCLGFPGPGFFNQTFA